MMKSGETSEIKARTGTANCASHSAFIIWNKDTDSKFTASNQGSNPKNNDMNLTVQVGLTQITSETRPCLPSSSVS